MTTITFYHRMSIGSYYGTTDYIVALWLERGGCGHAWMYSSIEQESIIKISEPNMYIQ